MSAAQESGAAAEREALVDTAESLIADAAQGLGNRPAAEALVDTVLALASSDHVVTAPPDPAMFTFAQQMRRDFDRLIMEHRFGIDEMLTKITILREEFVQSHRYNPIEHVTSRLKSPHGIVNKIVRRGIPPTMESVRTNITDIAGLRITCSFVADVYRVLDTLTSQNDVRVRQIKDYIANPKPNGYKSLHAIFEIPVYLSTGPVPVAVEVQIRTVAMDFWASLEHKIYYKYDQQVPKRLIDDLADAATAAELLDQRMEQLYTEVHGALGEEQWDAPVEESTDSDLDREMLWKLWKLSKHNQNTAPKPLN